MKHCPVLTDDLKDKIRVSVLKTEKGDRLCNSITAYKLQTQLTTAITRSLKSPFSSFLLSSFVSLQESQTLTRFIMN
jgi:hypothetical protein